MKSNSAEELVAFLIEKYESFDSYQDNVIIVCGEDVNEFMTHYKRPGKLCFEFSETSNANLNESKHGFSKLVVDEKQTKLKRHFESNTSVIESVQDCCAQSLLKRHYALGMMMMGFQTEPTIHGIKNPEFKDDEIYNEMNCYITTGDLISSSDIELTIDKEELLLRRVRLKESFRGKEKLKAHEGTQELYSTPFNVEIHYKMVSLNEPPDSIFKID